MRQPTRAPTQSLSGVKLRRSRDELWRAGEMGATKPAVPKYLEASAFGVQAKRKHPGLFSGATNSSSEHVARMLPQRMVARSTPTAGVAAVDCAPGGVTDSIGTESTTSVLEVGDNPEFFVANMPFACCTRVVYFEAEVLEVSDASDYAVNIGIEKRFVGPHSRGAHPTSRPQPSRDDSSRSAANPSAGGNDSLIMLGSLTSRGFVRAPGVGPSIGLGASLGTGLSESSEYDISDAEEESLGSTDSGDEPDAENVEDALLSFVPAALPSHASQYTGWEWLWKLANGTTQLDKTPSMSSVPSLKISRPLDLPLASPVRVGFMLDLVANQAVWTRNGAILRTYSLGNNDLLQTMSEETRLFTLMPTLTLQNATVRTFLGDGSLPNDGFMFDIVAYTQRQKLPPAVDKFLQDRASQARTRALLRGFFEFYGYEKTLEAFDRRLTVTDRQPRASNSSLRREVRLAISSGRTNRACELLAQAGVGSFDKKLQFEFEFQAFIEMIATSEDPDKILARGQYLYREYDADHQPEVQAKLEQASELLVSAAPNTLLAEALRGPKVKHKLTTAALGALSVSRGGAPVPELISLAIKTRQLLQKLARRGNGTASMLLAELYEQAEWS